MVNGGGAFPMLSLPMAAHADELANCRECQKPDIRVCKNILDLMTRGHLRPDGKILVIGGGIANFTDVFKGFIRALKEYKSPLSAHSAKIFWCPNYQEGSQAMRLLWESLGVSIRLSSLRPFYLPASERRAGFEVRTG
ncbi:hypothetical protein M378DRAFT_317460 [Amanita muscaria Koide BX008]|uniref:ATP-citrate synthase citrate-binding domain-containing protein n=1 Tax=Amanita muscaria (strain Koide BX008) TaxID=946122 RepID=A0A0C2WB21_AMAMK|nr:hypothetical protein M378DRAFT_317460 [Amanita muscaria Koide BX008]